MKYKKTLFGILIVCVGLFFIIWINRNKNHDPDSIYWAKEEFENEFYLFILLGIRINFIMRDMLPIWGIWEEA